MPTLYEIGADYAAGSFEAKAIRQLLFDLRDMIAAAEREHAEF